MSDEFSKERRESLRVRLLFSKSSCLKVQLVQFILKPVVRNALVPQSSHSPNPLGSEFPLWYFTLGSLSVPQLLSRSKIKNIVHSQIKLAELSFSDYMNATNKL